MLKIMNVCCLLDSMTTIFTFIKSKAYGLKFKNDVDEVNI